jgi:uncharacterized protein
MPASQAAKILRIHISESDRCDGKPLFEAIVAKCRELRIAGATVLQGLEGYGESAELHRAHLVRRDPPIVIVVVDLAENIERLVQAVDAMIDTGVLALSDVEVIRVQKSSAG